MQNVSKKRVNRMSHSTSLRRSNFLYHLEHQMVQLYHGYILHSKIFPTIPHMPKSELKRRSYGLNKLDKENYRNRENSVVTKFYVAQSKLYHNIENFVGKKFSIVQSKICRDIENFIVIEKLCRNRENSIEIEKTLSK